MTFNDFKNSLDAATTEEVVKKTYASYFRIKYDTSHHHALYTPQVFFEFKTDKHLQNLKALETVLAQALYYIRRLKYFEVEKPVPFFICLADKNGAALIETRKWSSYFSNDSYDWERAASEADHLKKVFPVATCFQYDYLNDDVEYLFAKAKLPKNTYLGNVLETQISQCARQHRVSRQVFQLRIRKATLPSAEELQNVLLNFEREHAKM